MIKSMIVKNKEQFNIAYKIRLEVFVKEQKVPIEMELDEEDKKATHLILLKNDKPIGCGRIIFYSDNKNASLGRIAIIKSERKKGYGKILCERLINICREKQIEKITIHAQYDAVEFYKKLGFIKKGKTFMEAGIKHIKMEKYL